MGLLGVAFVASLVLPKSRPEVAGDEAAAGSEQAEPVMLAA